MNTLDMFKYDILIRCKNEIVDLPNTLKSIHNQNYLPNNIIYVDSGSTDGSLEFAKKNKFKIINYKADIFNYSRSLNLGMSSATSDYVLILSAHCALFSKNSVENLYHVLQKYDAAGVFGRQIPTKKSNPIDIRDLLTVFGREQIIYTKFPFFHNAFSLIQRSAWLDEKFDETVNGIEDRLWALKQCNLGKKIIYEPSAIAYHEHGLNQSSSQNRAIRVCKALSQLHHDDIIEFSDNIVS